MVNKEEYYEIIKEVRKIASDPKNQKCSCPQTYCEWHGKCTECVAIHRYYKDHLPKCFQPIINNKIKAIASVGEMTAVEKEKTPAEYWDYIRKQDEKNNI